jgi:2-amino-4-hydroxy-6-hydroxymethyldihydropteridine diphosphokinase
MSQVIIAFGSNLGDSKKTIGAAIERLQVSRLFESAPMYELDQPNFLNGVALGAFRGGPWPLLEKMKQIERDLGRVPRRRNGPREIDLDIVAYGSLVYSFNLAGCPILQIPHPRVQERRFVLKPLSDLCPSCTIPGKGRAIDLLAQTERQTDGVLKGEDELLPVRSKG